MSEAKILKSREEISEKYKWAISDLYPTDEEWETELKKTDEMVEKYADYEGKLSESPDKLLEFLEFDDEISKLSERIYVYANQKLHENLGNTTYQSFAAKAQNLMIKISGAGAFVEPELLSMDESKLLEFVEDNDRIRIYKKIIKDLIEKKSHIRSREVEEILAGTEEISTAPSDIFALFNNADIKFPVITDENGDKVELTHGNFVKMLESENRDVRRDAFMAVYHTYAQYKNTLSSVYSANLKQASFYAKVRNYDSTRQMALSSNHIPEEVYDNLIETVHKRMPLMYKYVELRRKALNVDTLHMYDLYAPMASDVKPVISFEEAKKMVREGLEPMGEEYLSILDEGFNNGWIDIYENKGKRSGAYSWGAYGTHPYVLLNYQDNLNNVFTLAHEMGHAIHSYYSDKTQPYPYAGYKIFVAEVASTCNESLLIHHLISKTEDKKMKAYLINYFLEQFKGTLYRQTMFAEFEKITHQLVKDGEPLTDENLCQIYYNLNKLYFGDNIDIDKEIEMEWARIPHFYTPFYVYQYATGFSAAIALSKRIMKLGEEGVKDYMQFLTGGSSENPIDLLKMAGVDMSTAKPIEMALDVFEELLKEMEELL